MSTHYMEEQRGRERSRERERGTERERNKTSKMCQIYELYLSKMTMNMTSMRNSIHKSPKSNHISAHFEHEWVNVEVC